MDFDFDLDLEYERIPDMIINIEGMFVDFPQRLLEERQELMCFNTIEDNIASIQEQGKIFYETWQLNRYSKENFNKAIIDYFEDILETYKI